MTQENEQVERVKRTGKNKNKRPKKPSSPAMRVVKTVLGVILRVFVTFMLVFTITGCICGVALSLYVMEFVNSAEPVIDLDRLKVNQTALIYAKDSEGNFVEVSQIKSGSNSMWMEYSEIPVDLKDAVVATEDKRFYTHEGVDFKRTFGAVLNEVETIVKRMINPGYENVKYGGSTITQQLIKIVNGDFYERGVDVKIKEIIGAMNLERNYFSKDQILESYLNLISLGYDINGVGAAAKFYFDKDVSDLALDECVALSVISKSPSKYNPIAGAAENKKRRQYAYDEMLDQKYITQEEYDKYYDKELVVANKNTIDGKVETKVTSYFEDAVVEEIVADLMVEYNYSKEFATQMLHTSGWKIYTTMDIGTQKILDDYFINKNNFYTAAQLKKGNLENYKIPDAAYMVIMNYDGDIVAVVGNKGKKEVSRALNRATSKTVARPAGSTIKPLAVYAPAFEIDAINWSTIMFDEPVMKIKDEKTGEERDYPKNYDIKYEGPTAIIDAIKVSKNTIPVKLVDMMSPKSSFDFLTEKLHFSTLRGSGTNNDVTIGSMALGDGGMVLSEITAAFQIFGNGGYYQPSKTYSKIVDPDGKVILDKTKAKRERVISSETAYVMNKALRAVVNEGGSGSGAKMDKWEVIGKTGTSNDRRDLLFMGLTPYYYAGIRYGNDDNSVIEETGKSQMTVWREVMEQVHEGLNPAKFELPDDGVVEYEYCTVSGKLAHSGCPTKKNGYYKSTFIPPNCTVHDITGAINDAEIPRSTTDLNSSKPESQTAPTE